MKITFVFIFERSWCISQFRSVSEVGTRGRYIATVHNKNSFVSHTLPWLCMTSQSLCRHGTLESVRDDRREICTRETPAEREKRKSDGKEQIWFENAGDIVFSPIAVNVLSVLWTLLSKVTNVYFKLYILFYTFCSRRNMSTLTNVIAKWCIQHWINHHCYLDSKTWSQLCVM